MHKDTYNDMAVPLDLRNSKHAVASLPTFHCPDSVLINSSSWGSYVRHSDILLILPLFVNVMSIQIPEISMNFLRAFVIPCPRIFTSGKFHQISMYFPLEFPQAELQSSQINCRGLPVAASSHQLAPGSCQPEWSQDYWAYSYKKHAKDIQSGQLLRARTMVKPVLLVRILAGMCSLDLARVCFLTTSPVYYHIVSYSFLFLLVVCHAFLPSVTDLVIDWPTQQVHTRRHTGRKNSKDRYSWAPHIVPNAIHLPQRAVASECGFRQTITTRQGTLHGISKHVWFIYIMNTCEYDEWHAV